MTQFAQGLFRDANAVPLHSSDYLYANKTVTFAGGTTNDVGDFDGTGNPATLFTVTGTVAVKIFAVCTADLTGNSATLEVGITGGTATLIAQTTATGIDTGEIWHDATPDAKIEATTIAPEYYIAGGADIIQTVGTANITAGSVIYYVQWRPISEDANLIAA